MLAQHRMGWQGFWGSYTNLYHQTQTANRSTSVCFFSRDLRKEAQVVVKSWAYTDGLFQRPSETFRSSIFKSWDILRLLWWLIETFRAESFTTRIFSTWSTWWPSEYDLINRRNTPHPHLKSTAVRILSNVGIAIINHPFLMVYTTHLWWFGGWFIIAIPILRQFATPSW